VIQAYKGRAEGFTVENSREYLYRLKNEEHDEEMALYWSYNNWKLRYLRPTSDQSLLVRPYPTTSVCFDVNLVSCDIQLAENS
jgi:hypothetical protein